LTITGQPAVSADAVSHPADVRARDRDRVGIGAVDDRLRVVAGLHDRRERLELPARALELRAQPRLGQPGLALADGHDLVAGRTQPRGGAAQQGDALAAIAQRAGLMHRGRGCHCGAHVVGRRLLEARARLAGAGIDGVERERHAV
jgi:hypothetical protein